MDISNAAALIAFVSWFVIGFIAIMLLFDFGQSYRRRPVDSLGLSRTKSSRANENLKLVA